MQELSSSENTPLELECALCEASLSTETDLDALALLYVRAKGDGRRGIAKNRKP